MRYLKTRCFNVHMSHDSVVNAAISQGAQGVFFEQIVPELRVCSEWSLIAKFFHNELREFGTICESPSLYMILRLRFYTLTWKNLLVLSFQPSCLFSLLQLNIVILPF